MNELANSTTSADADFMVLAGDTKAVLLGAGAMFLAALVLGVWKYRQMATSDDHLAHPYVDTAHRAALLYSFATLLVAVFVSMKKRLVSSSGR